MRLIRRTVVLFGLVALALLANGEQLLRGARRRQVRRRSEPPHTASDHAGQRSASSGVGRTPRPSLGAFGRPSRGEGLYHGEPPVDHLYLRHRPGVGPCPAPSHYYAPRPPAAVQKPRRKTSSPTQDQMRGLDEQIQEIKSDSLRSRRAETAGGRNGWTSQEHRSRSSSSSPSDAMRSRAVRTPDRRPAG